MLCSRRTQFDNLGAVPCIRCDQMHLNDMNKDVPICSLFYSHVLSAGGTSWNNGDDDGTVVPWKFSWQLPGRCCRCLLWGDVPFPILHDACCPRLCQRPAVVVCKCKIAEVSCNRPSEGPFSQKFPAKRTGFLVWKFSGVSVWMNRSDVSVYVKVYEWIMVYCWSPIESLLGIPCVYCIANIAQDQLSCATN